MSTFMKKEIENLVAVSLEVNSHSQLLLTYQTLPRPWHWFYRIFLHTDFRRFLSRFHAYILIFVVTFREICFAFTHINHVKIAIHSPPRHHGERSCVWPACAQSVNIAFRISWLPADWARVNVFWTFFLVFFLREVIVCVQVDKSICAIISLSGLRVRSILYNTI